MRLTQGLALLSLGLVATGAAAADFDYTNDRAYQRKYPNLACIDTGPLSAEEAQQYNAAKLQELGRKDEVSVTRKSCRGDGKNAPDTINEKISGAEFLDRLYARLSSGPIPHGMHAGKVVLSRDRGLASFADVGLLVPGEQRIEKLAEQLWSGKFFDNKLMFLKNRINLTGVEWGSPATGITDNRLKFPAKLYCGQSLFDARRESIIIDYKYGIEDRPEGVPVDDNLDFLAGPKGLAVRDEVRMVKPGLYLGRAYMHGAFGLYFILEYVQGTGTEPQAGEKDACWLGHQRQRQLGLKPSDFINRWN